MKAALRQALETELYAILDYWEKHMPDERFGGFIGRMQYDNTPDAFAVKGVVLHARIMWTFAAALNVTGEKRFLQSADRAYDFIQRYFLDKEFGGVFWSVDYKGEPLDTGKQVYAMAFVIYAFSEYYKATQLEKVKETAIGLYSLLHLYSYDTVHGGYRNAFSRDWKDADNCKSADTHLHILEACVNLYAIWPDAALKAHITDLLKIFRGKMQDPQTHHLRPVFDDSWHADSHAISYGHDMQASWLLLQAAEAVGDDVLVRQFRDTTLQMVNAAKEGLDADGGLQQSFDPDTKNWNREKHWWPQAEALIAFINAWQVSGEERYLTDANNSWDFIRQHLIDKAHGEWFWGVNEAEEVMEEDKAGLWKCPYHNGRACLEGMKRLG